MSDIDTIRQRDTDSADTWFKEPPLGACGRAFIDRRRLLAEITQLRGTLSLAEEGLANYAQENERLKTELLEVNKALGLPRETADNIERVKMALRLRLDVQRATEKLQELAEECADCAGKGIIGACQAECGSCHDIRLVIAICLPTPQSSAQEPKG